jgi:3-oxoadipate enol-lactonase
MSARGGSTQWEKDAVLSPATVRRAGELLPSARVEVVTDAPHSMYWEMPQLFNDVVASFLRTSRPTEPRAR